MKPVKYILAALVITVLIYPITLYASNEYHLDGAILSEAFMDVINSIKAGDLEEARYQINIISNASLPSELSYIHLKTYNRLVKVIDIVSGLDEIFSTAMSNPSIDLISVLRSKALELYTIRIDIEDDLRSYASLLLKYVPRGESTFYHRRLNSVIDSFLNYLDTLVYRAGELIKELERVYGVRYAELKIKYIPNIVPAGSNLTIPLSIRWLDKPLENNTVVIGLTIGLVYYREYRFKLGSVSSFKLNITLPDSSELSRYNVISPEGVKVYGVIYLTSYLNNTVVIAGRSTFNFVIMFYRPSIKFVVPSISYYGEDIRVRAFSHLEHPINVSIYIDKIPYGDVTLYPGENTILIPYVNISKGYHRIEFSINPYGKYISLAYSASLAVTGKPIKALLTYSGSCIEPLTKLKVYGSLREYPNETIYLRVYSGDKLIFMEPIKELFTVDIPVPYTLFADIQHLKISIGPLDPYYDPYVIEVDILTVNLVGVLILSFIGLAGVYIGLSFEREIIVRVLTGGLRELYRGLKRVREHGFREVLIEIKESIAAKLYWSLVNRFPSIFPKPIPSETLREYYSRASDKLAGGVKNEFKSLTEYVEKDLYSRYKVAKSIIEDLVRRVRDEIK